MARYVVTFGRNEVGYNHQAMAKSVKEALSAALMLKYLKLTEVEISSVLSLFKLCYVAIKLTPMHTCSVLKKTDNFFFEIKKVTGK